MKGAKIFNGKQNRTKYLRNDNEIEFTVGTNL
jgi:hypothetical protein